MRRARRSESFANGSVVAQRDEIDLMQNWLRDRRQPVPAASATA